MIRRLYVHNFRCLENFELRLEGQSSVLLIGKNGSGKTAVARALEIFQKIARGTNRLADLVRPTDLAKRQSDKPLRFQIDVELSRTLYRYDVAFEFEDITGQPYVYEELLTINGRTRFVRQFVERGSKPGENEVRIDWRLLALPILEQPKNDPLSTFKEWLARMLILRPVPALINGGSEQETLEPEIDLRNFGAWFTGLMAQPRNDSKLFGREYIAAL